MRRDAFLTILLSGLFLLLLPALVGAAQEVAIPTLQIGVGATNDPGQVSIAIQVLLLLTVLALAPSMLICNFKFSCGIRARFFTTSSV